MIKNWISSCVFLMVLYLHNFFITSLHTLETSKFKFQAFTGTGIYWECKGRNSQKWNINCVLNKAFTELQLVWQFADRNKLNYYKAKVHTVFIKGCRGKSSLVTFFFKNEILLLHGFPIHVHMDSHISYMDHTTLPHNVFIEKQVESCIITILKI